MISAWLDRKSVGYHLPFQHNELFHLLYMAVAKISLGRISVKWSPIERREIRNYNYPSVFELAKKRNLGQFLKSEWRPTDVCILWPGQRDSSPKESTDRGRKKIESKWLARTLKRKWHPLPVSGNRVKENQFWNRGRGERSPMPNSGWRKRKESWTRRTLCPQARANINKSASP